MNETKWIRTAFWIGTVRPGAEQQFRDTINQILLPAFRALPGVRDAHACWPVTLEDAPPSIACQFMVEFTSRAELERMLASRERQALRPHVKDVAALFDGSVSHIEYEVV